MFLKNPKLGGNMSSIGENEVPRFDNKKRMLSKVGVAISFGLLCSLFVILVRFSINDIARAYLSAGEYDIFLNYLQFYVNQTMGVVILIFVISEFIVHYLGRVNYKLVNKFKWLFRIIIVAGFLFLALGYEFNIQRWYPAALTSKAFFYDILILLACLVLGSLYHVYMRNVLGKFTKTSIVSLIILLISVNGTTVLMRQSSDDEKPNIIFLVVDALRGDHLGYAGYSRPTSPNIDALAEESVVFTQCYSQGTKTKPSIASLFVSQYPSQHSIIEGNREDADGNYFSPILNTSLKTMAEYLKESGYNTVGLLEQGQLRKYMGFGQGFNYYNSYLILANLINDEFFDWLPFNKHRKFFAYLHYQDVHAPYTPIEKYSNLLGIKKVGNVPTHGKAWQKAKDDWRKSKRDHNNKITRLQESEVQALIDSYDAEIRAIDDDLGQLIQVLKEKKLYNNSIIVLTADHGEGFNEHGLLGHGNSLYEEVINVPLLIRFPDKKYSGVINSPVQLIDLLPTLLDYLKIEKSEGVVGRNLITYLDGEINPEEYPVFSEMVSSFMIRKGDMKLIYNRNLEKLELYDLKNDHEEQNNLALQKPDLAVQMKNEIIDWIDNNKTHQIKATEISIDTKTIKNLKSLGYLR